IDDSKDAPRSVDVTLRRTDVAGEDAIAEEARKGYDLLFVGIEKASKNGGFHPDLARIAAAFEGPLAVVVGSDTDLEQPERGQLRFLVPLNGRRVSRRAAGVAIAIARAWGCPVTALYVANPGGNGSRRRRKFRARLEEQAIIKDFVELADR